MDSPSRVPVPWQSCPGKDPLAAGAEKTSQAWKEWLEAASPAARTLVRFKKCIWFHQMGILR
jgi:hypothetical protein